MHSVRNKIAEDDKELRQILANKESRKLVGDFQRDERRRAPKGFDTQRPALDLIKKKDWILDVSLDPSLATTPKLYREILDRFRAMAPFIEFLNRPLAGRKLPREPIEAHL